MTTCWPGLGLPLRELVGSTSLSHIPYKNHLHENGQVSISHNTRYPRF